MGEKFNKMFKTVGGWADTMGSKVGGWFGDAKKSVGGWFKDSWTKAKDLGKSIVDKGKKAFDATMDAAKTLGKGVIDKGKKLLTGGVDLLKGAGNMLNKVPGVKQAIDYLEVLQNSLQNSQFPLKQLEVLGLVLQVQEKMMKEM